MRVGESKPLRSSEWVQVFQPDMYARFMFIHYPKYAHSIRNVSHGLIFGGAYIWKDIWASL